MKRVKTLSDSYYKQLEKDQYIWSAWWEPTK